MIRVVILQKIVKLWAPKCYPVCTIALALICIPFHFYQGIFARVNRFSILLTSALGHTVVYSFIYVQLQAIDSDADILSLNQRLFLPSGTPFADIYAKSSSPIQNKLYEQVCFS